MYIYDIIIYPHLGKTPAFAGRGPGAAEETLRLGLASIVNSQSKERKFRMDTQKQPREEFEIDIMHLVSVLWKKAWIIIIAMALVGAMFFSYAYFFITPQYQASALMYVNNSTVSIGGTSLTVSAGQITAARTLLDTYLVILKTRSTFERVVEKANIEGLTVGQLMGCVSASSVNETEVFRITVTHSDPEKAMIIANTIMEVLPDRLEDIVAGSHVSVIDTAIKPGARSSPDYTRYAMLGVMLGLVASAAIIIIIEQLDTSVKNEDYLSQRYDFPVLAVIPDVYSGRGKRYGYYKSGYYKSGYYGRGYYGHRNSSGQSETSKKGGAEV